MDDRSTLSQLLLRARRRCLAHLVLDQSALALTIGMGGAILLLLAGTQILDWYWVVLLAVASLGVGLYRLRKTIPSNYVVAQRLDRKLKLADTLSTASYFSSNGKGPVHEQQRREADTLARTVDVRQGIPFVRSRYLYPAIALAAAACGLFTLRYAMTGSLNLQPSLVRIALDTFFPAKQEVALNRNKDSRLKSLGVDPSSPESQAQQAEAPPDATPDTADAQDADSKALDQGKSDPDSKGNDQADKNDKGDDANNGNDPNQDKGQQGDSKNGKDQNKDQNGKDSKQGSDQQNSSLMDKLKDAMSNMLSKMKSQPDNKQSANSKNGQQGGKPDKSNQKNGQSEKNSQSEDASAQSDQQQGDAADKKQSADAGAEKGSNTKASQDSKSGIGSADGEKSAREAEQLAAMGKISEILGKRSATVSGEVMVEVGSSKQQLKTPWAQRQASHSEAGGEIHRDEIPLMYQQFVQQYFEEIRKTPEATGSAKPAGVKAPRKKPS